jgi:hypothetical protein
MDKTTIGTRWPLARSPGSPISPDAGWLVTLALLTWGPIDLFAEH